MFKSEMITYFVYLLQFIALNLFLLFLSFNMNKFNSTLINLIGFSISCYIALFSEKIVFPEKVDPKNEIKNEINLTRLRISRSEFRSLFTLVLLSFFILFFESYYFLLFTITFIVSGLWSFLHLKYIFRYILEIPKLYFAMMISFSSYNLFFILLLVSVGSLYYKILPRGLGIIEILSFSILFLQGYTFLNIVLFIGLIRVIGFWLILPYYFIK